MIRFLINAAVFFATAAIGLLVANIVLEDMTMDAAGFFVAAVIFALAQAILAPFIFKVTRRNAQALLGAVGLVTTFIALAITTALTPGLSISGASTWVLAALVVWLATMAAAVILPLLVAKRVVQNVREP